MLQVMTWLSEAADEIEHISEWTGLSVGLLLALAIMVWRDPALCKFAIRAGIAIVVLYLILMYGYRTGMGDKQAEWTKANALAAQRDHQRDAAAAADAGADAAQASNELAANQKSDQEQIDALRKIDAACHPITGDQLR